MWRWYKQVVMRQSTRRMIKLLLLVTLLIYGVVTLGRIDDVIPKPSHSSKKVLDAGVARLKRNPEVPVRSLKSKKLKNSTVIQIDSLLQGPESQKVKNMLKNFILAKNIADFRQPNVKKRIPEEQPTHKAGDRAPMQLLQLEETNQQGDQLHVNNSQGLQTSRNTKQSGSLKVQYRDLALNPDGPKQVLWPLDQQCSRLVVRFGKHIEPTLLHSYPRSGNTWVRYLLEAATGVFTSSVYKDFSLIREGYLGERSKLEYRDTIATKIHFVKHLLRYSTVPAITIIRNPARMIVSYWSYSQVKQRRHKHTAVVSNESFNTTEFRQFCQVQIPKWLWTTRVSLEQRNRTLLPVYYENLKKNPIGEVRRMLDYLRLQPDEERLSCLTRHVEGKMKAGQKTFNPFTREEKKLLQEAVDAVTGLLAERGFPPLPKYSI